MDHKVHTEWANRGSNSSTDIYAQLTEEYTHMPYVEGTAEHLRMTSLFNQGGTYYSNLWCKAIATIIFEEIFKGDPFSRPGGEYFREHFLKHGASCNPRELVENLTGTKLTPARLATALTKPIELSKSFEQGWLDEKGVRGVSPVKVIDVPHELSTSPLLYRLADTHPQLLDEQGQFKEKVFDDDRARLQGIAAYGGEGLLERVASKHPHLLNKQGQLRDNLFGKDLDKLEKLSKLEHTPYSKIKRGIKRLKGVQEEGPKKISD